MSHARLALGSRRRTLDSQFRLRLPVFLPPALSSQVILSLLEGRALPGGHGVPYSTELGVQRASLRVSRQRPGLSSTGTTERWGPYGAPQSSVSGHVRERAVGSLGLAGRAPPPPVVRGAGVTGQCGERDALKSPWPEPGRRSHHCKTEFPIQTRTHTPPGSAGAVRPTLLRRGWAETTTPRWPLQCVPPWGCWQPGVGKALALWEARNRRSSQTRDRKSRELVLR